MFKKDIGRVTGEPGARGIVEEKAIVYIVD